MLDCMYSIDHTLDSVKKKTISEKKGETRTHTFIQFIEFIENAMLFGEAKKRATENIHATPHSLAEKKKTKNEKKSQKRAKITYIIV